MPDAQARVDAALATLYRLSGFDGDHHKMYAIDQTVRVLTGCPPIVKTKTDVRGKVYSFIALGESEEYLNFVKNYEDGEDGPRTYEWDTGIAP